MLRFLTALLAAAPWLAEAAAAGAAGHTLRVGRDGASVSAVLQAAEQGDTVVVPAGVWRERLVVNKRVTLRGEHGAVLDGGGVGSTVRVEAAGARLVGLRIRHSGSDLAASDACIFVAKSARGAVIARCQLAGCAFGIWVDQTDGARVVDNRIAGSREGHRSNRGNGIHLFDAKHLLVRKNRVSGGRDGIYVSATEDSVISGNVVEHARYCVHYMFSYRNRLVANVCRDNSHGYALMESHHITVEHNVAERNAGQGLLFRDAEDCTIVGNRIERNGQGLFFYSSVDNVVTDNLVRGNAIGAKIWAGSRRNRVERNRFIANAQQIFYVGASDLVWGNARGAGGGPRSGNYYSDYLGWDHDGDGRGDRPYRVDSFAASLIARFPAAALLMNSPALELLQLLETRMPLLRTPTVVDESPLVRRPRGGT